MNERIRVLNCLSDPRMGGPQQRTLLNAKRLRETTKIETEFLLPDGSDEFEKELHDEGFIVHRPQLARLHPPRYIQENLMYMGQSPIAIYRIFKIIRNQNIDIVHVNAPDNFAPAVAGWLSSSSVAWHFNGYNLPTSLIQIIKRIAPILADEFIFSSSVVRDHIFGTDTPGTIIFPPVDTDTFDPSIVESGSQIRDEFGIDQTTPVVGTVGNITPAKDHERLLRSVRQVIDEWGEIAVPIVGGVSDTKQDYFERLRTLRDDLDLSNHVFFLGWQSDIRELLTEFDLFVLSSKMETGPMSLMEAMAMEVPAVTTRVGVVRDINELSDIVWVAAPESTTELGETLQQALISSEKWSSIGERSRECAKQWFSLRHSSQKHYNLYRSLL